MATAGTPYEGRDNTILDAVYTGLDLRLYTNTADSLSATTVLANLTYPSGSGYATISLSGVWSSTNGVITYDHGTPDNPLWTAGDDWSPGVVTGVAITDSTYLLHFKDLTLGAVTMTTGKVLEVDISTLIA